MTKSDLINKLNKVYNDLDSLPDDSSLKHASRDIDNIRDTIGDITQDLEDNGIEQDNDIQDKE